MEAYKSEFIEFMVTSEVLTFGDFVTKSGRQTPFFVNTGRYRTGSQIHRLAGFYAEAIVSQFGGDFEVLFGPAYKGIPLAVATAMRLYQRGIDIGFCFNRKEVKDHGEGGTLVGRTPRQGDRVLIIEDVTTQGTSVREVVPTLAAQSGGNPAGLVVSVDRMERGLGKKNALAELAAEFNMKTFAIVTIEEVMSYLRDRPIGGRVVLPEKLYERMRAYRELYGGAD